MGQEMAKNSQWDQRESATATQVLTGESFGEQQGGRGDTSAADGLRGKTQNIIALCSGQT